MTASGGEGGEVVVAQAATMRVRVDGEVNPALRSTLILCAIAFAASARSSIPQALGTALGLTIVVLLGAVPAALVVMGAARWVWRWDISYGIAYRLHAVALAVSMLPARLWLIFWPGDALFHPLRVWLIDASSNLMVPLGVWGLASIGEQALGWPRAVRLWGVLLPFGLVWGAIWFLVVQSPK